MKEPRVTLIINQKEISEKDLTMYREDAIDRWHNAQQTIINAEIKRRDAEAIVEACNARLRLLRLMSNS